MTQELLQVESAPDAQGTVPRRGVPELLGTGAPNPEWAQLWAQIAAGTVETRVVSPQGGRPQTRVVLDAGALAAVTQQRAVEADRSDEIRARTFQVFRRAPNAHAKSPVEAPEIIVLGAAGDTFSAADLAQIQNDLGAARLVPLP